MFKRVVLVVLVLVTLFTFSAVAQEDMMGELIHGIGFEIDGETYYFAGAPVGDEGAQDVPGHYWTQVSDTEFIGLHYNSGPNGAAQWWSSDAEDGALLFAVDGVIDTWSEEKVEEYVARGYPHYHEMVTAEGELHPELVVWLRHIALGSFNFDGGPMQQLAHEVVPGLDREFMFNASKPYEGEEHEG
jgi:hypothetical protein